MTNKKIIIINKKKIGPGNPVFIIAEAGFNHNGRLDIAKRLVDAAKKAGADCVKFQKREISELAIGSVLNSENPRFSYFGSTYAQARSKLELTIKDYQKLIDYCDKKKITFLCTPFDIPSVDILEKIGVSAYKLASHSMTNIPLLKYVAKKKLPVVLSTGMSSLPDVDEAVNIFTNSQVPLLINHCVSVYPQKASETNLEIIKFYRDRFKLPVGYSGHESGTSISLAAVAMGAVSIERHFTLDKNMPGPDHGISLEPLEFEKLSNEIRVVYEALGAPDKKILPSEIPTAKKYHYSLVSATNINAGAKITSKMLTTKNPGTGISPNRANDIIGKNAKKDIPKDTLLKLVMFK